MSTHAGNILTIHSPEGPRVSNRQRQEVVDGVDESSAAEGHFQLEASPAKELFHPEDLTNFVETVRISLFSLIFQQ